MGDQPPAPVDERSAQAERPLDDQRSAEVEQRPDDAGPTEADVAQAAAAAAPVLPGRAADDSDVGWGEPRGQDDDERFLREVPPHW